MNSNSKNYKTLKALVSSINDAVDALENGSLNITEIENILDDARALHERIAIIQYLTAQPKENNVGLTTNVKEEAPVEKPQKVESFRFDFSAQPPLPSNQTSLLDAIEEEKPEEISTQDKLSTSLNFNNNEEEVSNKSNDLHDNSINAKFSDQAEVKTLAQKLSKKPISNIIEAIGLNQKFLIMNELFEGENTYYKEAIEQLNNFNNFEEANNFIQVLAKRHDWDFDSNTVKEFLDIVERRYL